MKKMIVFIVCFVLFKLGINAQQYYLYTPNGSRVLVEIQGEEPGDLSHFMYNYFEIYGYDENLVEILAPASITYNCHGFAWIISEYGFVSEFVSSDDLSIFWEDSSYVETTEEFAEKIVYDNGGHSAVKSVAYPGMYVSKWGPGPLVRHSPAICPWNLYNNTKYYRLKCPSEIKNRTYTADDINIRSRCDIEISNITIEPGAVMTVKSGTRIRLLPGFHAKAGSRFHAKIESCESTSGAALSLVRERNVFDSQDVIPEEASKPANIISSEIEIYPNPASSIVTITAGNSAKINRIKISNSLGITVLSVNTDNTSSADIDISALAKGIYFVSVFTENNKLHSSKLIKK